MSDILQKVIFGLQQGSVYALIALGYTMVYGVLRLINFAHGDVFMVGAFVGYYTATWMKIGEQPTMADALIRLLPVLLITMLVCAILGLLIERLAYKPLRKAPRLTALITAIGVSLLLENGGQLIFGANPKFFPDVTPQGPGKSAFAIGGVTLVNDQLVLVTVAAVLMAALWYIVQYTSIGRAMRAVSHDTDAASLMGINTDGVISFTFALGAALAGAAGMLFAALTHAKILPLIGIPMGLKAFVAAVVGGIGSIPGAMLGGLLMGLSEAFVRGAPGFKVNGVTIEPSRWAEAVAFVLLILVLLLRPAGLLGRSGPEKV